MEEPNRINEDVDRIIGLGDSDDQMLEIISILNETEIIPDVGNYYTFIYKAKTPRITYDEYPLIACVGVYKWGFRGLNYHWGDFHNYTWEEVVGLLHVVRDSEISDMRSIPYQKFKLNT